MIFTLSKDGLNSAPGYQVEVFNEELLVFCYLTCILDYCYTIEERSLVREFFSTNSLLHFQRYKTGPSRFPAAPYYVCGHSCCAVSTTIEGEQISYWFMLSATLLKHCILPVLSWGGSAWHRDVKNTKETLRHSLSLNIRHKCIDFRVLSWVRGRLNCFRLLSWFHSIGGLTKQYSCLDFFLLGMKFIGWMQHSMYQHKP